MGMEIALAFVIALYITKNGVSDVVWAARGRPSPKFEQTQKDRERRLQRRAERMDLLRQKRERRAESPFRRYLKRLVDDTFIEAHEEHDRHMKKVRDKQAAKDRGDYTPGAAEAFLGNLKADLWKRWDATWQHLDAKRRQGPDQNGQTTDDAQNPSQPRQNGPEAPSGGAPGPEPGGQPSGSNAPNQAETANAAAGSGAEPNPASGRTPDSAPTQQTTQEPDRASADQATAGADPQPDKEVAPPADHTNARNTDQSPGQLGAATNTTQNTHDTPNGEGDRTVSSNGNSANGEVTGLASAMQYVEAMASASQTGANSVEQAIAGLEAGEVTGPAIGHMASGQEHLVAAAAAFGQAATVLQGHQDVAESYNAHPDAGNREFVTSE